MIVPAEGKRFIHDDLLSLMRPFHREVQAAVCARANLLFGHPVDELHGVFQYQGGVVVGDHFMGIYNTVISDLSEEDRILCRPSCPDKWKNFHDERPRERATRDALMQVANAFQKQGIVGVQQFYEGKKTGTMWRYYDPLRGLFNY